MFQEVLEENNTGLDDDVEHELVPLNMETVNARQVLEGFLRGFCEVTIISGMRCLWVRAY